MYLNDIPYRMLPANMWHCFGYPHRDQEKHCLVRVPDSDVVRSRMVPLKVTGDIPRPTIGVE